MDCFAISLDQWIWLALQSLREEGILSLGFRAAVYHLEVRRDPGMQQHNDPACKSTREWLGEIFLLIALKRPLLNLDGLQ